MRHLVNIALLVAGGATFALGLGPIFFGAPLLGVPLLLAGLGLETAFWVRLRRSGRSGSARNRARLA